MLLNYCYTVGKDSDISDVVKCHLNIHSKELTMAYVNSPVPGFQPGAAVLPSSQVELSVSCR